MNYNKNKRSEKSLTSRLPFFKPILIFALIALLAFAFWLRWKYIIQVSLYEDEFITLWASQQTLEKGVPLMPSGVFYIRGILSTYVIAAMAQVAGLTPTIGRLSSAIFGLGFIWAIFYIGYREWNLHVGWLAALGMVLLSEAIQASGRARFYAQLLFFVLLTIWTAYIAIQEKAESGTQAFRKHLLFALYFTLALFSQEETILLYPSLLLSFFLWRGWRYLLRPAVFVGQVICVAAMGLRYAIEQLSQPGYFDSIQEYKPYIDLNIEIYEAWSEYRGLFISQMRSPWTFFALLAVLVSLVSLWRVRFRPAQLSRYHQATLFFAIQFFSVLFALLTVVAWRENRYIWMIESSWILAGAAGAIWLTHQMIRSPIGRWLVTGLLSGLIIWSMLPSALATLEWHPTGYYEAFDYVKTHRQANDIVMTPQPPACAFVLGEGCDYYARQKAYEPYVVYQEGKLVDRWSGAQLLDSTEQLENILRESPAVWLVSDMHDLESRYQSDFVRLITQQFEVVFNEGNIKVLLAKGWRQPPEIVAQKSYDPPISVGPIRLIEWERSEVQSGKPFSMILFWESHQFIGDPISTSLQLVASDGRRITQADGPPTRGIISPFGRARIPLPDLKTLTLPDELPRGRYCLEMIAYTLKPLTPLSKPIIIEWLWLGSPPLAPTRQVNEEWQNGITLVGYDEVPTLSPNDSLTLRLVWMTSKSVPIDYTIFVHLIGPDGLVAQSDQPPENGFYPTSSWVISDLVEDHYTLQLPATLPAGDYRLLVGLYEPQSGERVRLMDGSDAYELRAWP